MRFAAQLLRIGLAVSLITYGGTGFADSKTSGISRPAPTIRAPTGITRPTFTPHVDAPVVRRDAPATGIQRPVINNPVTATPTTGIQRPGSPPVAAAPSPGGIQRPQAGAPRVAAPAASPVDRAMARGQSKDALATFQANQAKYKAPPVGAPVTRQAAQATPTWKTYGTTPAGAPRWSSADHYYADRQAAINRLPPQQIGYWRQPPTYVVNLGPSYHGVSTVFMCGIVGTAVGVGAAVVIDASYAHWAYAHRTSPAYTDWHTAMMLQAEHDEDVRYRMAALDRTMSQYQEQGVVADATALPEGVDPSMVVAEDTVLMATSSVEVDPNEAPAQDQDQGGVVSTE